MTEINEFESFTDYFLQYANYVFNIRNRSPVKSKYFRQESYQKWALYESLKYVFKNPNQKPLVSLLEFYDLLEKYSNDDYDCIFSTAKEVVESIIYHIYD